MDGAAPPESDAAIDAGDGDGDGDTRTDAGDGDGDGDAGSDAAVGYCVPPSPSGSTGSADEPAVLALEDAPLLAEVDPQAPAFIRVTGLTAGTAYDVILSGSYQLRLKVYDDDAGFSAAVCDRSGAFEQPTARCALTASADDLYVQVLAEERPESFELDVVSLESEHALDPEGTQDAPLAIALGALPHTGHVGGTAHGESTSFYEITGLTPHVRYAFHATLDSGEPGGLAVADDAAFSSVLAQGWPRAIARADGASLFVAVWGSVHGSELVLQVEEVAGAAQGSQDARAEIAFNAWPYTGSVAPNASPFSLDPPSFYELTGVPDGLYVLRLETAQRVMLRVSRDPLSSSGTVCALDVDAEAEECSILFDGTPRYVDVTAMQSNGGPFTLDLTPAEIVSEGTVAAPIEVELSDLPLTGQVDHNASSYYELTGLHAGDAYAISLSDAPDLQLSVSSDAAFAEPQCVRNNHCVARASGSSLFVAVTTPSGPEPILAGTTFSLDATRDSFVSEGTLVDPVELDCSGPYQGVVAFDEPSYYVVRDLGPGAYVVSVSADAAISFTALEHRSQKCGASDVEGHARCVLVIDGDELRISVTAERGTQLELTVADLLPAAQGTRDAPRQLALDALPARLDIGGLLPGFYEITGTESGHSYYATIANEGSVALTVPSEFTSTEDALTVLPGSARTFLLPSPPRFSVAGIGARFAVSVAPAGVPEPPHVRIDLELDDLPQAGSIVGPRTTTYRVSGLDTSTLYTVSIDDVTAGSTHLRGENLECTTSPDLVHAGAFIPTASALSFYVESSNAEAGTFVLDIDPSLLPEGSAGSPLAIAASSLPHAGTTACIDGSYYAITGLTAGKTYVISVEAEDDDLLSFSVGNTCTYTDGTGGPRRCEITADGSAIQVWTQGENPAGTALTLDAQEVSHTREGTAEAPIALALASPHAGSVTPNGESRYALEGLSPGRYLVMLSDAEDAVRMTVSEGAQFLCIEPNASSLGQATSLRCEVNASGAALAIAIQGNTYTGADYTIEAIALP